MGHVPRYLAGQPDRRPGRLRIVAVNGTHRPPDALAPLINVRSGAEGDRLTPNVTKRRLDCLIGPGDPGGVCRPVQTAESPTLDPVFNICSLGAGTVSNFERRGCAREHRLGPELAGAHPRPSSSVSARHGLRWVEKGGRPKVQGTGSVPPDYGVHVPPEGGPGGEVDRDRLTQAERTALNRRL